MTLAVLNRQSPFVTSAGSLLSGWPVFIAAASPGDSESVHHRPVLVAEAVDWLAVAAGATYVDGTVGEGGHAAAILEASGPDGCVLGIDRDPRSVDAARRRLTGYGERARIVHGSYADMRGLAHEAGFDHVDGVLLDLGFSSRQIDADGYGFSFQRDEPLDMRYDTVGDTAADLLNHADERDLADLIYRYGEERRSRSVARAIVQARPLATTGRLASVVASALGGRRGGRHPATKTFQALRIAVNRELMHLQAGLEVVPGLLQSGGRLVVISYHSLEDRLVKGWMDREAAQCVCPPELPVCSCEHEPSVRFVRRRVVRPSATETENNPRSRSARLRAVERI